MFQKGFFPLGNKRTHDVAPLAAKTHENIVTFYYLFTRNERDFDIYIWLITREFHFTLFFWQKPAV